MAETCYWCGSTFERRPKTKDHLNPVSKGGVAYSTMAWALTRAGFRGIVPACERCNWIRGDERGGEWVPYPHWLGMSYRALPRRQYRALKEAGKIHA